MTRTLEPLANGAANLLSDRSRFELSKRHQMGAHERCFLLPDLIRFQRPPESPLGADFGVFLEGGLEHVLGPYKTDSWSPARLWLFGAWPPSVTCDESGT